MRQEIFNTFDLPTVANALWDEWDEAIMGMKPADKDDPAVWNLAAENMLDEYRFIVSGFTDHAPDTKVLVYGRLGLWNSKPFAYKVSTTKDCFACKADDLIIFYEDGDLWVEQYHHDGTNVLKVRGLRDISDIDPNKFSKADYEEIEELLLGLSDGYLFTEEYIHKWESVITFSLAPYIQMFMGTDAQKDLAEHNPAPPDGEQFMLSFV